MANGACDICGRPATARVRASVNGRVQNMELCDQHYSEMARRSGRSASPLESLFGRRSLLDEFFGESGFGSLFGDSPLRGGTLGSMGDGDDAVVDATFGEGAPRRGSRRGGGRTIADRLSEQGNKLLQDAAQKAGEFGRSEVDTEHLLLALTSSDVVKTILEQFKVDVDDLRRQIEKEAKRGDAKTEGEIGVSPRLKDALNRAFIASNELGHSYVGPEHLLIGLAEEGEGLAAVDRTVELHAVLVRRLLVVQPAGVVHGDIAAAGRHGTGACEGVDTLEFCDAAAWRRDGGGAGGEQEQRSGEQQGTHRRVHPRGERRAG